MSTMALNWGSPLDWANWDRELMKRNTLPAGRSTPFTEYGREFLTSLMQGTSSKDEINTDEIAHNMLESVLESGQSLDDAWYGFLDSIFSAAEWTSDDSTHERLVALVFALANHAGTPKTASPNQDGSEASRVRVNGMFNNLEGFGWMARDLWNGEHIPGKPNALERLGNLSLQIQRS